MEYGTGGIGGEALLNNAFDVNHKKTTENIIVLRGDTSLRRDLD